jgi:hypothetical protein
MIDGNADRKLRSDREWALFKARVKNGAAFSGKFPAQEWVVFRKDAHVPMRNTFG